MKFFIKDFFSKSLMENIIFYAVQVLALAKFNEESFNSYIEL